MRFLLATVLVFLSFLAQGQPIIRNYFTTNLNPVTTGVVVGVNTNALAVTNGGVVTISGVTDTNVVRLLSGNAAWATNSGNASWATNAGNASWSTNSGSSSWATNSGSSTWATNSGSSTFSTNAANSTNFWGILSSSNLPPVLTNEVYASNIVSGGIIPVGTFASTTVSNRAGAVYEGDGAYRWLSYNGDSLTNNNGYAIQKMADTNWVLSQFSSIGAVQYFSATTNAVVWTNTVGEWGSPRTNNYQTWLTIPSTITTQTFGGLTANAYIRHSISTNYYPVISAGPATVSSYVWRSGAAGTISGHYELYALDGTDGHEIASSAPVTISASVTTPTLYQWNMTVPVDYTATNVSGVRAVVAFKLDSVVAGQTLNFINGSNYDAHMTFVRPLSSATINASQIAGTIVNPLASVAGTRTFTHDSTHTVITNTATLTSSEWNAGRQLEWYNGAVTMEANKTNGVLTAGSYETTTNTLPFYTTIDCTKGYVFLSTNAAFTLAFSATYNATNDNQGLIVITNTSASTFVVTISGVNPPNSAVTFGCTNGQLTYLAWDRSRYHTNVLAWDTYKSVLK